MTAPTPTPPDPDAALDAARGQRLAAAKECVRDFSLVCAGLNLVPVPFLNSAAIAAIQLAMLAELSRLYGVPFDRNRGRHLLTALGFGAAHSLVTQTEVSRSAQSWLASIPGTAGLLGAAAWPAVTGFYTHRLGLTCVQHFESGGKFDPLLDSQLHQDPLTRLALAPPLS